MNAPREGSLESALQREGSSLLERYRAVRDQTVRLAEPLSAEDACVQSMPDASPAKWHLAHTTWFFETFVLEPHEKPFRCRHPAFRVLFNSYYNGVGDQHPRPRRGLLTRPSLAEVLAYREDVDGRMERLLEALDRMKLTELITLGLNHEQQHQELLLTDVKHLLAQNPLAPAYHDRVPYPGVAQALGWRRFDGGLVQVGHDREGFAFDNESPRHSVHLEPFELASRLVTNAEYRAFVEAGGYRAPALWLSEGWEWLRANAIEQPMYWSRENERPWNEFTLSGRMPLQDSLPAVHLSYFEADAYARWWGARLPSESEWELAAQTAPVQGHFVESGQLHPAAAANGDLEQLFGDAWEWTQSSYAPYPGYRTAEGAIGEYNGKFMVNQYVLRGGSCATPADHIRASYRNFFPTSARWQFSGIRLARDA